MTRKEYYDKYSQMSKCEKKTFMRKLVKDKKERLKEEREKRNETN